jgi:hypothetical protein
MPSSPRDGQLGALLHGPSLQAMAKARSFPNETCQEALALFESPYLGEVTHQAVFACVVLWENPHEYGYTHESAEAIRKFGLEILEILELEPSMESYWNSDPQSVETYAIWARMHMADDRKFEAEKRALQAAEGFFRVGGSHTSATRGLQHLSDAICLQRQQGRTSEAEATFDRFAATPHCPWRNVLQRPCSFSPAMLGVPFPTEPVSTGGAGLPVPAVVRVLEAHFTQIESEFAAMLQPVGRASVTSPTVPSSSLLDNMTAFDQAASSGPRLAEGRDPNAWHALAFCA